MPSQIRSRKQQETDDLKAARKIKPRLRKFVADVPGVHYKPISSLVAHEGTDLARVGQYKRLINAGHPIPPLLVTREAGGKFGVEDGKHRLEALRQSGQRFAPVIHREGMTPEQHDAHNHALDRTQAAIRNL